MGIFDWLPMPPNLGPPFPRFLGLYWPWLVNQEVKQPASAAIEPTEVLPSLNLYPQALSTYNNEERWEIKWNADGLPEQIIVHRHATKDQEK